MYLFRFLVYKRAQRYFSWKNNRKSMLNDGLLALIFLFYGTGLGVVYTYKIRHNGGVVSLNQLLSGVGYSMLITPILLKFFPGFRVKAAFIGPQYPQSRWLKALLDLVVMGLIRTRNAIYLLYMLSFCIFSTGLPAGAPVTLALFLLIGILTGESLVNALSWRVYFHAVAVAVLFVGLLWGSLFHEGFGTAYLNFILAAMAVVLACFYFLFYQVQAEGLVFISTKTPSGAGLSGKRTSRNPYLRIMMKNRNFVTVVVIGLIFKLAIMVTFVFKKDLSIREVVDRVPFIVSLITPIILFTYIYNNLWGYFYPVGLNNLLTGSNPALQIRMYLAFLAPALLLDFVLTFGILFSGQRVELKLILTYIAITALSIPIGIISSFRKYFFVTPMLDFNQFRGKTSRLFSFALIIAAILGGVVYNQTVIFSIFLALILLLSLSLFIYINKNIDSLNRKFKLDFFK